MAIETTSGADKTVKEASTQIRWEMLGRLLTANVPFAEGQISIDIDKVHESWKDFLLVYGICQSTKDGIASKSYSNPGLKSSILEAQVSGNKDLETALRAEYKLGRVAFLKENANDIRAALWKSVKALESEKPAEKEAGTRESKAAIEARVKAETIAKIVAGLKAMGLDDEQIVMMTANL